LLSYERQLWQRNVRAVAGVDEVGRGPLAGPVMAAAVVFDPQFAAAEEHGLLEGLTDSKLLTARRREEFFRLLADAPGVRVGLGVADVAEIDELNIMRATHLAMLRAVADLVPPPEHALIDGCAVPGMPCPCTAIVGGDSKSLSVAAASVVAKVVRDHRMREYDAVYPQYGFARHKGYGSATHIQALFEYGPCPIHRRSFRPVREAAAILGRDR